MDEVKIIPGAEPFFYPGNEIGCMMVHGFTGTPWEMRWLGQHLHEQGYTVYGPRLTGHGTTTEDINAATWRDWYGDLLDAAILLRGLCRKVFVLGLSMGGILSLTFAARETVDGVVAMSTPYRIADWRVPLVPLLGLFISAMPKNEPPPEDDPFQQRVMAEQRRRGEEAIGHPTYPVYPAKAIRQLLMLLEVMRSGLPRVSAPTLLMHSRSDEQVPFDNLPLHYDAIGSQDKEMLILEKSLHVITEDVEREIVFQTAADFIAARS